MGYTVSIRIVNEDLRKRMFDFLCSNFVEWHILAGEKDEYLGCPQIENLSYDHDPEIIGFDYTGGVEREYAHAVIRWIGMVLGINSYRYDGEETPIKYAEPFFGYDVKDLETINNAIKSLDDKWKKEG